MLKPLREQAPSHGKWWGPPLPLIGPDLIAIYQSFIISIGNKKPVEGMRIKRAHMPSGLIRNNAWIRNSKFILRAAPRFDNAYKNLRKKIHIGQQIQLVNE